MTDDIKKYQAMSEKSFVPNDILMAALNDGLDEQDAAKVLIQVSGISHDEAQQGIHRFRKYRKAWLESANPRDVYKLSKNDGLDFLASIRLLRHLCGLDLIQAKEVIMMVEHDVDSLTEYQQNVILPALEKAIEEDHSELD